MAGSIIRMVAIEKMVEDIRYKGQILARTHKIESGIMDSGLHGFGFGLIIALLMVLGPVLLIGLISSLLLSILSGSLIMG